MEKKTRSTIRLIKELDQHHARLLPSPKWTETTCMLTKIAGSPSFPTYVQERQRSRNNCQCGIAILFSLQPQKREKLLLTRQTMSSKSPTEPRTKGSLHHEKLSPHPYPNMKHAAIWNARALFLSFGKKFVQEETEGRPKSAWFGKQTSWQEEGKRRRENKVLAHGPNTIKSFNTRAKKSC